MVSLSGKCFIPYQPSSLSFRVCFATFSLMKMAQKMTRPAEAMQVTVGGPWLHSTWKSLPGTTLPFMRPLDQHFKFSLRMDMSQMTLFLVEPVASVHSCSSSQLLLLLFLSFISYGSFNNDAPCHIFVYCKIFLENVYVHPRCFFKSKYFLLFTLFCCKCFHF